MPTWTEAGPSVPPEAREEAGLWQCFLGVTHMMGPKDGPSASLPPAQMLLLGYFPRISATESI